MQVRFWTNFTKRTSSTKLPASNPNAEYNCKLVDDCSRTNPVIYLSGFHAYSYAYIVEWGRYYFVRDVNYNKSQTYITLEEDFLASFRTSIGASSHYVLRSAADYDANLADSLYPALPKVNTIHSTSVPVFTGGYKFIIQYAGKNGTNMVLLDNSTFAALCNKLWVEWGDIDGMSDLYANLVDPMQYITGVQKTAGGVDFWNTGTTASITCGLMDLGIGGSTLTGTGGTSFVVGVPKHPQAEERPYLKSSPYSEYSISIPGCGWIPLNANDLYDADSVTVLMYGDAASGRIKADVVAPGGVIASATGNINTQWSIGSNSVNFAGTAMNAVSGIASFLAKPSVLGAVNGIMDTVGAAMPTYTNSGSNGGAVGLFESAVVQLKYQEQVDTNPAEHGRPLMKIRRLDNLPGYIICESAEFFGAPLKAENEAISAALNGGFYYE